MEGKAHSPPARQGSGVRLPPWIAAAAQAWEGPGHQNRGPERPLPGLSQRRLQAGLQEMLYLSRRAGVLCSRQQAGPGLMEVSGGV